MNRAGAGDSLNNVLNTVWVAVYLMMGNVNGGSMCNKKRYGKHSGKFDWKKYTRYNGALKMYWTMRGRRTDKHRINEVNYLL